MLTSTVSLYVAVAVEEESRKKGPKVPKEEKEADIESEEEEVKEDSEEKVDMAGLHNVSLWIPVMAIHQSLVMWSDHTTHHHRNVCDTIIA